LTILAADIFGLHTLKKGMFVALFGNFISTLVSIGKPGAERPPANLRLLTIEPGVHDNYSRHLGKTPKALFEPIRGLLDIPVAEQNVVGLHTPGSLPPVASLSEAVFVKPRRIG
jgi:hypothetical protein